MWTQSVHTSSNSVFNVLKRSLNSLAKVLLSRANMDASDTGRFTGWLCRRLWPSTTNTRNYNQITFTNNNTIIPENKQLIRILVRTVINAILPCFDAASWATIPRSLLFGMSIIRNTLRNIHQINNKWVHAFTHTPCKLLYTSSDVQVLFSQQVICQN